METTVEKRLQRVLGDLHELLDDEGVRPEDLLIVSHGYNALRDGHSTSFFQRRLLVVAKDPFYDTHAYGRSALEEAAQLLEE